MLSVEHGTHCRHVEAHCCSLLAHRYIVHLTMTKLLAVPGSVRRPPGRPEANPIWKYQVAWPEKKNSALPVATVNGLGCLLRQHNVLYQQHSVRIVRGNGHEIGSQAYLSLTPLFNHSICIRCCMYILYIKNVSFFTVHVEYSQNKKCSLDKQSIPFVARSKGKCFLEKYYSW